MNPFSDKNSVIIMNNTKIHHNKALVELVKEIGKKIIYLSLYFLDFNPIKIAFLLLKV